MRSEPYHQVYNDTEADDRRRPIGIGKWILFIILACLAIVVMAGIRAWF